MYIKQTKKGPRAMQVPAGSRSGVKRNENYFNPVKTYYHAITSYAGRVNSGPSVNSTQIEFSEISIIGSAAMILNN